jgi:hypothetical protein
VLGIGEDALTGTGRDDLHIITCSRTLSIQCLAVPRP